MVDVQTSPASKKLIPLLVIVIVFAGAIAIYRSITTPPKYVPKYQTVAHRSLDLENSYDKVPEEQYRLLDELIDKVKTSVSYDASITDPKSREKQLRTIFATIDSILIENNFVFPPDKWTQTLGEALEDYSMRSRELDVAVANSHNERRAPHMRAHCDEPFHLTACNPAAFLYMGLCESLGLELRAVLLPEHIFVRAEIDAKHHLNFDPNRGRSIADAEYIEHWGVHDWQVRDAVFMHPLSPKQLEAQMYASLAESPVTHSMRGFDVKIACLRKALELDPQNLYAMLNLSSDLLVLANPSPEARKESLSLAERAVDLQPYDGKVHRALSFALADMGRTGDATAEMQKAIELDPEDPAPRAMLPLIQQGLEMHDVVKSQSPLLFWIAYEYGWLYVLVIFASLVLWVVHRLIKRAIARKPSTATVISASPSIA